MVTQVVIGKQGTQPFPINDPNVSRKHATLYIDNDTGVLTLVDDSSTNGTYIHNGMQFMRIQPNKPVQVRPDTMLRLGPETRFHVRRLLPQGTPGIKVTGPAVVVEEKAKEKPKKVNIKSLRDISEEYMQRKAQLDAKANNLNGMRSLTIVLSTMASAGSAMLANSSGLDTAQTAILTAVILLVLIGTLLMIINHSMKKVSEAKHENERNYAVKYCCPQCHYSFRGKYYENILASGKCPNCKCEYHESN